MNWRQIRGIAGYFLTNKVSFLPFVSLNVVHGK